jgi:hypothetical protein
MKKLTYTILISAITSFLIIGYAHGQDFIGESEAESVLNDYFRYLKTGDTDGIIDIVTGPLLKKRERLLRYNPQYPDFLRKKYKDAHFSIIRQQFIDAGKLALDVQIYFTEEDNVKTRFVLVQENGLLKIYSEGETF